ncbi:Hypothetical_protein [Hexamita inflata]|uniref:Hypothetical_protein n=1 Tax=Hexamita inflata TaxID=28002 RepID=A0AA86P6W9_9EUKA|nr:Hypothetical protein HINF_LOCUS20556 [Hexamita inflata]
MPTQQRPNSEIRDLQKQINQEGTQVPNQVDETMHQRQPPPSNANTTEQPLVQTKGNNEQKGTEKREPVSQKQVSESGAFMPTIYIYIFELVIFCLTYIYIVRIEYFMTFESFVNFEYSDLIEVQQLNKQQQDERQNSLMYTELYNVCNFFCKQHQKTQYYILIIIVNKNKY